MDFSYNDLSEARKQIDSILYKLREALKTLIEKENIQRYKSQITLVERRIHAFEIALSLIENELKKTTASK